MLAREPHYMIDIETTGVNQETDDILEIAMVRIEFGGDYWHRTGDQFSMRLHSKRQPESDFAKKHMKDLYAACNALPETENLEKAADVVRQFIHNGPWGTHMEPKFFMGWNASNFDMPFMFKKGLLTPSFYAEGYDGKEKLYGDAHYRIYEQTGSVQVLCDITGLDRKSIEVVAMDLNPTSIELPKGKEHDALYDCYKQIIMQNGLIKIARMGIRR